MRQIKSFIKVYRKNIALLIAIFASTFAVAEEPLEQSATNPSAWKWYYNVSASTISNQISNGYRIVDLDVVSTSSYRFNVAMVKNSGVHASGWWWYYGITASQLSNYLSTNGARLIDIESYFINGQRRFAVVMIKNTGSRASGWWYYYGQTLSSLQSKISQNNARLIDLDTYVRNGTRYYDAVMIRNTGSNAKGWWWYTNVTTSQIKSYIQNNGARLIDLERQSNGRYTVVMVKNSGTAWWWHYGVTASTVSNFTSQYGARIIDIETYMVNGSRRFNVIYINNVNSQTSRVRDMLSSRRSGGDFGLYVKRVNSTTHAALNSTKQFEPASTIKALHHIHGMRRVFDGLDTLNDWVYGFSNYWQNSDGTNTSCPRDTGGTWVRRDSAHRMMMENSDNRWTQALRVNYGEDNLNDTADDLNMWSTSVNHRIGCGSDASSNPNRLTLVDAGRLYEAVRNGYLGTGTVRDSFYDLMLQGHGDIDSVIDSEAAKISLSTTKRNDFKSRIRSAAKAGSYGLSGKSYRSIAGWVSMPSKTSSGAISTRHYVHGIYVDEADSLNNLNVWDMRGESLREQIRSALITFKYY
ncbi:MAG: serine hydrolase [Gammaproteobacteria bacterium]|nr:serine hydrolase [Gammaproteobacteria bacterium]